MGAKTQEMLRAFMLHASMVADQSAIAGEPMGGPGVAQTPRGNTGEEVQDKRRLVGQFSCSQY